MPSEDRSIPASPSPLPRSPDFFTSLKPIALSMRPAGRNRKLTTGTNPNKTTPANEKMNPHFANRFTFPTFSAFLFDFLIGFTGVDTTDC